MNIRALANFVAGLVTQTTLLSLVIFALVLNFSSRLHAQTPDPLVDEGVRLKMWEQETAHMQRLGQEGTQQYFRTNQLLYKKRYEYSLRLAKLTADQQIAVSNQVVGRIAVILPAVMESWKPEEIRIQNEINNKLSDTSSEVGKDTHKITELYLEIARNKAQLESGTVTSAQEVQLDAPLKEEVATIEAKYSTGGPLAESALDFKERVGKLYRQTLKNENRERLQHLPSAVYTPNEQKTAAQAVSKSPEGELAPSASQKTDQAQIAPNPETIPEDFNSGNLLGWRYWFLKEFKIKCLIFCGAILLITVFAYRRQPEGGGKKNSYVGFVLSWLDNYRLRIFSWLILWLFGTTILSSFINLNMLQMVFSWHLEILGGLVILAMLPKGTYGVMGLILLSYTCYIVSELGVKLNATFFIIGFLYILVGFSLGLWLKNVLSPNYWKFKKYKAKEENARRMWVEGLGSTHAERVKSINEIFDRKDRSVSCYIDFEKEPYQGKSGLGREDVHQKSGLSREDYQNCFIAFSRHLASMEPRNRETLRAIELLHSITEHKKYEQWYDWAKSGLIWDNGKATIVECLMPNEVDEKNEVSNACKFVSRYIEQNNQTADKIHHDFLIHLEEFKNEHSQDPELGPLLKSINARFMSGNVWLAAEDVSKTLFAPQNNFALRIGLLEDSGQELTYSGEGSLISIAPPGSGKTQCNVFPNLLTWRGPAVVLDVKGEIYAKTSKWRAENVGPVFKFSPLDPARSHCYNPLSFVRLQADYIWEDSRFIADMMIVPTASKDPFWENKARDVLTAAIAYVCYASPPDNRPMAQIMDIIHGGKPWAEMVRGLQAAVGVRSMKQQGTSLAAMDEKTRDSVLQTAQSSLSAWAGERISRVTQKSDWSPLELRSGKSPTIYICLKPSEVDSYISLLRVFIAQHIRILTNELPPHGCAPILFLLDELPRLKQMPPVEEAIEIGRQYGIRLWMFAQSLGQLEQSYPNAEGLVGSCAVRIFMNPSSHDGTTDKLSEELGFKESALDGSRIKAVEATDLAGPDYKDYQIVMAAGCKPVKVKKAFAWQDTELTKRMGSL